MGSVIFIGFASFYRAPDVKCLTGIRGFGFYVAFKYNKLQNVFS